MAVHPEVSYFLKNEDWVEGLSRVDSVDFWRQLNPHLSITDEPFNHSQAPFEFSEQDIERAPLQIGEEGYLQTRPAISLETCQALAQAVHNIAAAGLHPLYLGLYDEFWQVTQRLRKVMGPVLGDDYKVLGDFWSWRISPETGAGWAAHRDYQFPAERLREDGRPTIVTVWLPLTDATPLNGCMYLLPMTHDPNIPDNLEQCTLRNLQDIRALPAPAGSVLAWNQYVIHWGTRCTKWADGPRISVGIYFQSGDRPLYVDKLADFSKPLPFERRLGFVASNFLNYNQYHGYPDPVLAMCFRQIRHLPNFDALIPEDLKALAGVAAPTE